MIFPHTATNIDEKTGVVKKAGMGVNGSFYVDGVCVFCAWPQMIMKTTFFRPYQHGEDWELEEMLSASRSRLPHAPVNTEAPK